MRYSKYSLIVAIFLLFPFPSKAASLEYSYLIRGDVPNNAVTIRYGSLENKSYYSCSFDTLICANVGSTAPTIATPTTDASDTAVVSNPFDVLDGVKRVSYKGVSPDGKFVYYYQYSTATDPNSHFVLYDTKTGGTSKTTDNVHYWDLLTEENRLFSVASDSKTLVYLDNREGSNALYKVDLAHPKTKMMLGTRITKLSYSVSDFIFLDPNTILFMANREIPQQWNLYLYNLKTSAVKKIASNTSYADAMIKVGSNVVFLQIKGNTVIPVDYNYTNKTVSEFFIPQAAGITAINNPYQLVKYGSVNGVLLKPSSTSTEPHPLIIWLHGGPYRDISSTIHPYLSYGVYDWDLEEARRNGAVVLKIDYHGSYGQGRPFAESLKGQAGVLDVADVVASLKGVKKTLGTKYKISGVYLVGNSYGGYLALKTITDYPKSFAGAYSINGVTDWPTLITKLKTSIFNVYFNGLPTLANSKLYAQAEIVDNINSLTTQKIILLQAQSDTDVSPVQADFLFNNLNSKGKNVQIIKIPDEDHVFKKNSSITEICSTLLTFIGLTPNDPNRCQYQ